MGIGATQGTQDEENPYNRTLQVMGNPVLGTHTLSFTGRGMAGNQLQIDPQEIPIRQSGNDKNGVWVPALNFDKNQQSVAINLSPFPKGIYLLTIKTNDKVFTGKIVLQ